MSDEKPLPPMPPVEEIQAFHERKFGARKGYQKLTFEGQCRVYACLHSKLPSWLVFRMFNLSRSTVSYIGGCRDDDRQEFKIEIGEHNETIGGPAIAPRSPDRRRRYQAVADEFDRLGEEEFIRTYFYNRHVTELRQRTVAKINSDPKAKKVFLGD